MDTTSLIGKRVGRLTVLRYSHSLVCDGGHCKRPSRSYFWECRCDCGNKVYINRLTIVRGRAHSCGCLRDELARERQQKHGHKDTESTQAVLPEL